MLAYLLEVISMRGISANIVHIGCDYMLRETHCGSIDHDGATLLRDSIKRSHEHGEIVLAAAQAPIYSIGIVQLDGQFRQDLRG